MKDFFVVYEGLGEKRYCYSKGIRSTFKRSKDYLWEYCNG